MKASGNGGKLSIGYQLAAVVGHWELVESDVLGVSHIFTGTLTYRHGFWGTQLQDADLVLKVGSCTWRWAKVANVYVDGMTFTGTLHGIPKITKDT